MDVKEVVHFCLDEVLATLTWFSLVVCSKFLEIEAGRFEMRHTFAIFVYN